MEKDAVLNVVKDKTKTYSQQVLALAQLAEGEDRTIDYSKEFLKAKEEGIICDLNEGKLPYRPRYICPDYKLLLEKGSEFLNLEPALDLYEACNNLLIMYKNVPSITTFPVFLGNLDELLEPFVLKLKRDEAKKVLRMFLRHIDSTLTDSFVHADFGPKASLTGEIIFELSVEMQLAVPNITLKYDEDITPDDFAKKAIVSMLKCAKPSFANHKMFTKEWGENYAIASCYNGLLVGGGGYTLPRIKMYEASLKAKDTDDFLNNVLPFYVDLECDYMDKRIRFLQEESSFFNAPNFLIKEGFISKDRFVGMFGMVGLAECVDHLLGIKDKSKGFGNSEEAKELGIRIMNRLEELVNMHEAPYSKATGGKYRLHAQVGINTDGGEDSPGSRIPVGCEPILPLHLHHQEAFQKYFPTGTGDIFKFEETWVNSPDAVLDIIKGTLRNGLRYFSGYLENNDVVRVTGYLVKKSELAKLDRGEASLNSCTLFGQGSRDGQKSLDRKINKYEESFSK